MLMSLTQRVRLGAEALSLRLKLASMLEERSLPELLSLLTLEPPRERIPMAFAEEALSWAEKIVARLRFVPSTCLYRSLVRYAMLRRAGYDARFVMGLSPSSEQIEGHAWVELEGRTLGEELDPSLVVTYSYPQ